MRFLQFIAVTCLTLIWALAPACADKRVALVVGNAAYHHADALANPRNDARGVRDALTRIGFDVTYGEDLDLKGLQRAIGQFAGHVEGADVALVYFAGHGATFGDTPYVVPVDAEFSSLSEVSYELVSLETLIGELRRAKGVRIAILDACRDNAAERALKRQVAGRGGEVMRGLGPMKNPDGLILAYATQYLSTAADSAGSANSPFTAALLKNIATPGLDVKELFFKVGQEVVTATGGRQRPEISVSMYERYALVPAAATPEPTQPVVPPPAVEQAADEVAWNLLKDTRDPEQLRRFMAQFPRSQRHREAEERLKALEQINVVMTAPARPSTARPAGNPCSGTPIVALASRRAAPLSAMEECSLRPQDSFRECENCPEMTVVPAGAFLMGSNDEQDPARATDPANERPQHEVVIRQPIAVGRFEVTREQFETFVLASGYRVGDRCHTLENNTPQERTDRSFRNPGFAQSGTHPAVCTNWLDAKAYVGWLSQTTGKAYRLLSEAEWEYVARAGSTSRHGFAEDVAEACKFANGADQSARLAMLPGTTAYMTCSDGYAYTAPVGSYRPNAFGLFDLLGNVWEWTEDCFFDDHATAPSDGSARTAASCLNRTVRGGSWFNSGESLRPAVRAGAAAGDRYDDIGFRVARPVASTPGVAAAQP